MTPPVASDADSGTLALRCPDDRVLCHGACHPTERRRQDRILQRLARPDWLANREYHSFDPLRTLCHTPAALALEGAEGTRHEPLGHELGCGMRDESPRR